MYIYMRLSIKFCVVSYYITITFISGANSCLNMCIISKQDNYKLIINVEALRYRMSKRGVSMEHLWSKCAISYIG